MIKARRIALLAAVVACLGAGAVIAPGTEADQTVHAHITRDGSTVVSGYDGGVALKP